MKKQLLILVPFLILTIVWTACEDYSTNVDPLIDAVEDYRLSDESQVQFLINGLNTRFATTHDILLVCVELLSDGMFFDSNIPNATYPTFFDIDAGDITYDNNSVDNAATPLNELRFMADDLVRRCNDDITFGNDVTKNEALFWGYFYGGVARHFLASYFGLTKTQGGGVISASQDELGSFIPSADMYALALEKFDAALAVSADPAMDRVINSLKGLIYLALGNKSAASTAFAAGMVEGDAPFQSLHNVISDNYFWQQAGKGRCQVVADFRYQGYIDADPMEAERVKVDTVSGTNGVMYYMQDKYPVQGSPINLMTWQVSALLAGLADPSVALANANAVRASYGIDALEAIAETGLLIELDKEACFEGIRDILQNTYDMWHIDGGWQYLPITQDERNINTNL